MASWRASRWKRAQAAAIAALGYPVIAALGSTLRWRVSGLQHFDAIRTAGRQPVMAFWHGRILPATVYFRRRGIVVITSENFDGEWIARIIERFGYGTARGSTSTGGKRALLQLVREMKAGHPAGFTLDGPRGPARVAQPGRWDGPLPELAGQVALLLEGEPVRHVHDPGQHLLDGPIGIESIEAQGQLAAGGRGWLVDRQGDRLATEPAGRPSAPGGRRHLHGSPTIRTATS